MKKKFMNNRSVDNESMNNRSEDIRSVDNRSANYKSLEYGSMGNKNPRRAKRFSFLLVLLACITILGCSKSTSSAPSANINTAGGGSSSAGVSGDGSSSVSTSAPQSSDTDAVLAAIPSYTGSPYTTLNDNKTDFPESDFTTNSFETYSNLDSLGRCGTAYANIGEDLMPTEKRGDIYEIKPTGWHAVRYDFVDGGSLYNRCHLIAHELTAENANEKNLITGTRYLNTEGMQPFENMTADYIKETKHHVLYKVTPLFAGNNLVATGVIMEAESVEDKGEGICFNIFCYNVQPGVTIDYATGDSSLDEQAPISTYETASSSSGTYKTDSSSSDTSESTYILNTSTMKFHRPDCPGVEDIKDKNKKEYTGSRDELIAEGYTPCHTCNP